MGRLYVVPTPIGNLEDITLRALRVLGEVDVVFAEDTRHTRKLFARHGITTPLQSYHQHTKLTRLPQVLAALGDGDVALVSDAGMPAVSDPGFEVIRATVDAGFEVDVLPGPSAAITAVVGAALPAPGFLFVGFLPRRASERHQTLASLRDLPYSLVLYEAPHRVRATLSALVDGLGDRPAVAARELSKLHQEYHRGTLAELATFFETHEPRGEFTVVISPAPPPAVDTRDEARDELRRRMAAGGEARTSVAEVSRAFGIGRNEAYKIWLEISAD